MTAGYADTWYRPRTWEAETGESKFKDQPGVHKETLSKNARERKEIDQKIIEYVLSISSKGMCLSIIYLYKVFWS